VTYRTGPQDASPRREHNVDAVVIGDGLIGLSTAYELARERAAVCLLGAACEGSASEAAAGLLAPSIGTQPDSVRAFFEASLSHYPELLARIEQFDPTLHVQRGLIEVFSSTHDIQSTLPRGAFALKRREAEELEPGLSAPFGAVLHPDDGAIDNVRLVRALRAAVSAESTIDWRAKTPATRIDVTNHSVAVHLDDGSVLHSDWVILAAGAWSPHIAGLPRRVPVSPLKGQMLSLVRNGQLAPGTGRPIMGTDVYIVPRRDEIVVGATVEHADFDLTITDDSIERLRSAAVRVVPTLASASIKRRWAGTRPATPDMLPIIGADPDDSRLIYACGHSKNGILLAPATARAVTSLVRGLPSEFSLEPFSVTRFGDTVGQ
jgi:glycine oxidase ThiO